MLNGKYLPLEKAKSFFVTQCDPRILMRLFKSGTIHPEWLIETYSSQNHFKKWNIISGCYLCMISIGSKKWRTVWNRMTANLDKKKFKVLQILSKDSSPSSLMHLTRQITREIFLQKSNDFKRLPSFRITLPQILQDYVLFSELDQNLLVDLFLDIKENLKE